MKKRAFVTGSTGFLGFNLCRILIEDDWEVFAMRRSSSDTRDLDTINIQQVMGDINDKASLVEAMPNNVDAVFHTAADTSTWVRHNKQQDKINIEGTRNLVEVALQKKAKRFIHTSSIGAYGRVAGVLVEDTPSEALSGDINYYRSKYLAEQEIHQGIEKGLDAVILNPAQIVGPYDYRYLPLIFESVRNGSMVALPKGTMFCAHVRDYAKAHVAAYEKGTKGENYLLGGEPASFKDIIEIAGELMGVKTPKRYFPERIMKFLALVMEKISLVTNIEPLLCPEKVALMNDVVNVDSSKASRELDFSTCSVREMYQDFYQWHREIN